MDGASNALIEAGLEEIEDVGDFHVRLDPPRKILLYGPAGPVVDEVLEELVGNLESDDVVADGRNSYRPTRRRRRYGSQFCDASGPVRPAVVAFVPLGSLGSQSCGSDASGSSSGGKSHWRTCSATRRKRSSPIRSRYVAAFPCGTCPPYRIDRDLVGRLAGNRLERVPRGVETDARALQH